MPLDTTKGNHVNSKRLDKIVYTDYKRIISFSRASKYSHTNANKNIKKGVMCLVCGRLWTALQVLWSTFYVICGAAQLMVGVFFLISVPDLQLYGVLIDGAWVSWRSAPCDYLL
ncbi:unnamed protein product [Phyllotreta striolata]|uniref:Uncharacterized protein n=1 Tax=Phyllotreta striolata TaxID=444603 RepID=A0A9N9XTJ2_PHYSR|nr:unnamed protein product [Phyllotreta striolata]